MLLFDCCAHVIFDISFPKVLIAQPDTKEVGKSRGRYSARDAMLNSGSLGMGLKY
jgi:hypothetical protein